MMNDRDFEILQANILSALGIDLRLYKPQQMRRRLSGYLAKMKMDARGLGALISSDADAARQLRVFITINVSSFFRDEKQFDLLKTVAFPDLLRLKRSINVWSAGCSHGGEPYSVAIMLNELDPDHSHNIVGTDLDREILAKAKAGGPYTANDVMGVEGKYLRRYFENIDDTYFVIEQLRNMVNFKEQNLLADRFARGVDMILCRNVVIYFSDEAKQDLYARFNAALNPGGYLFIGGTESLLGVTELGFERVGSSLYRATGSAKVVRKAA